MGYKIYLPKPCSENWDKMSPIEKGKLCEICNRKVYDLTQKTNLEIISLIDSENRICGKAKNEQIKAYKHSFKKLGVLFSLSSIFTFSNLIYAKPNIQLNKTEIYEFQDSNQSCIIKKIANDSLVIYGTVTENRIPLPKAIIKLKGTNIQTETDFNGNFKLTIPKVEMIILEISYIGMNTKEIQVKNIKRKLKVELESEYILGEIIYKKSLWKKIFG